MQLKLAASSTIWNGRGSTAATPLSAIDEDGCCDFCISLDSRFYEHHVNGDPTDLAPSNIKRLCFICFRQCHLEYAEKDDTIIYLPELAPIDVMLLIRGIATQCNTPDQNISSAYEISYAWLRSHSTYVEKSFGTASALDFLFAMNAAPVQQLNSKTFEHLYLLPRLSNIPSTGIKISLENSTDLYSTALKTI